MTMLTNPYIAGNPVGNTPSFVGRDDVLREVVRVLRQAEQNAITLYGQRRIGKTSVLQALLKRLPDEGCYRPVYFDLQDKAALPLGRVLSELARALADELRLPAPDLGSDPETAFRRDWLPGVLAALPEDTCLVLLFDEFDVLADPQSSQAAAAFFPYLRDLLALDRARLQFVFVLGRNPGDLSSIALSIFKGVSSQRVSLLSEKNAERLVRLSEQECNLQWESAAVQAVWQLAHGHPFLTQALCSQIWERAHDESDSPAPVTAADVEAAVPATLEASRSMLEWLWDGLGPVERIVASALAQSGPGVVDEAGLERILREGGVRIIIRELQNAPQLLQDWDLLEPSEGGYIFRVELLRQWIENNRPLKRVQQEMDRVQPLAENLYNADSAYYQDAAENTIKQALRADPNPFTFGSPVLPAALHGRHRELRRLVGRILQQGQSSALVGEPRTGKTSLLYYLMSPDTRADLYGEAGGRLLFRYFDALTFDEQFNPAQFWERALEPVSEVAPKDSPLVEALRTCRLECYGNFVLERLFTRLQAASFTLVLLLDGFDALVEHSAFQQAEFYGGLRALASRYTSLALVIAARQSLGSLNRRTQSFSRNGSPFFNIMEEIVIGPLAEKGHNELLACAEKRFGPKDRRYLLDIADGHPYLLQAAASALWDVYEEGETNQQKRWKSTGEALYDQAAFTLASTWRFWSAEMKKAFTIVALDELPLLLGEKQFDIAALLKELPNYNPELRELKRRGFIQEDESAQSGWSVTAGVMLWWLADEWTTSLRKHDDLGAWLNDQGWEGMLKVSERKQISAAAERVGGFLKDGLSIFIKAAGEGLGKRVAG